MATMLILHDVDDVDHWLNSPKREELFGPLRDYGAHVPRSGWLQTSSG